MLIDLVTIFHVKQSDFRTIKWFLKKNKNKTVTERNAITSKLLIKKSFKILYTIFETDIQTVL